MSLSSEALVTLVQAKNYLKIDAAASLHVDAEFVGVGNGSDVTFDLDNTPVEGSLILKVDNVLQVESTDFTISAATITWEVAPVNFAKITASYDYAADDDTFDSYDDDLLERLIEAATRKAEDYVGRFFVQRETEETRIGDNKQVLKLYRQPIVSVASITVSGDAITDFSERLSIGRIYHLVLWPLDYEIVVTYTAGYGANRAAVQPLIPDAVAAVLLILADLYENRGDTVDSENISGLGSTSFKLPSRALELLKPLRTSLL